HKAALVTVVLPALFLMLGAGAFFWWQEQRRSAVAQAVAEDLKEADIWQQQERWDKALQVLERASARLGTGGTVVLQDQVAKHRAQVGLIERLEDAQLQAGVTTLEGERDFAGADQAYQAVFSENGLDVAALPPSDIARRIGDSTIRTQLVT